MCQSNQSMYQLVHSDATRLLTGSQRFTDITPLLEELHWLPSLSSFVAIVKNRLLWMMSVISTPNFYVNMKIQCIYYNTIRYFFSQGHNLACMLQFESSNCVGSSVKLPKQSLSLKYDMWSELGGQKLPYFHLPAVLSSDFSIPIHTHAIANMSKTVKWGQWGQWHGNMKDSTNGTPIGYPPTTTSRIKLSQRFIKPVIHQVHWNTKTNSLSSAYHAYFFQNLQSGSDTLIIVP